MYIIVFGIILSTILISTKIDKKWSFIISYLFIGTIIVFRFGVGSDYFSYEYLYNEIDVSNIGNLFNSLPFLEIGFRLVMYIGRLLSLPYHIYFAILELVMLWFALKWIYDTSDSFEWSVLLFYSIFFIVWNLSAIRQGMVLFIGFYYLLNRNFRFTIVQQALLMTLLVSFHVSALIFIPLIYLSKKKFTKKQLLILLLIALISTFIPLEKLFLPFVNIPFLGKLNRYISNPGSGFFDFPGLVRLVLVSVLLFFYDDLQKYSNHSRILLNLSIMSFIMYFFLKFSEIAASRLSIIGYFAIIVLFPIILIILKKQRLLNYFGKIVIVLFCFVSIYKEIHTAMRQSGFSGSFFDVNTATIFNVDRYRYFEQYNLIYQKDKVAKKNYEVFKNKLTNNKIPYAASKSLDDGFIAVYFENKKLYGIINNKGEIVEDATFTSRPQIIANIVIEKSKETAFKMNRYRYIGTDTYLMDDEIEPVLSKVAINEYVLRSRWINFEHYAYDQMQNLEIVKLIKPEHIIGSAIGKYGAPIYYSILEVSAFTQTMYVFLHENGQQMNESVYYNFTPFSDAEVAIGSTHCGKEYINADGNIIWVELNRTAHE